MVPNPISTISLEEAYKSLLEDNSLAYWFFPKSRQCMIVSGPEFIRPGSTDAELAIVPGSFNPIHASHRFIYQSTGIKLTAYEMSITRIDKPPVTLDELGFRVSQFEDNELVLLTNAPRMIHKLALLRGYTVVVHVGMDTILRMAADYGDIGIGGLRANFVVNDRIMNGQLLTLKGWKRNPGNIHRNHAEMPEHLLSLSSTALREQWRIKTLNLSKQALNMAKESLKEKKES